MASLKVNYLGLELANPIIVSSSPFTSSVEKLLECESAGAGAVVLKSLFEEQIQEESTYLSRFNDYPEAADYLDQFVGAEYIKGHLEMIKEVKAKSSLVVIASINCIGSSSEWVNYAKMVAEAGADALEINLFTLPVDVAHSSADIEQRYLEVVAKVVDAVSIPVSIKLGAGFTNIMNFSHQLYLRGVKGVVMFNRFFEPDIDIDTESLISSNVVSSNSELRTILRSVAICASKVDQLDIAVTTGVHSGSDVIKTLLAGAKCVEICSAIYNSGLSVIEQMKNDISTWMEGHNYTEVSDFCGKLSYKGNDADLDLYQRVQYLKYFPRS